jgi:predicted acetyltransferase
MRLIEPTREYIQQIRDYRQEFIDDGSQMAGTHSLIRFENPEEWIESCCLSKDVNNISKDRVPATQYIFVREEDEKIVGMLQIRHYFNYYIERYAGHIGYSVAPTERRKGYATQMLGLALQKCKELDIDKVLILCTDNNVGSRKTILNNGGVYESTVYEPDKKINLERYWININ